MTHTHQQTHTQLRWIICCVVTSVCIALVIGIGILAVIIYFVTNG